MIANKRKAINRQFSFEESPMSSANTAAVPASQPGGKRGVIDQFEGDLATIVFDDNEQLVVARSLLPANARSGDVVTVRLPAAGAADAAAAAEAQSFAAESAVAPSIEVQAEDTAASQQRIRSLLDDIFKK
jgi:hypothetical protein